MKKTLLLITAMFLFFAGCKKDDTLEASKVELKNNKIEKGWDYLKISAEYEYPEELVSINLCLSEKEDMSGAKTYKCDIEGKTFSVEVDELKDGTKYYYQFEYDNGCWKEKSKKENVATYAKPVVITNEVTNKTPTSATLNGNVVCPETENKITVKGFCWGTEPGLTTEGTHTNNGTEIGTYSFNLSNLTPNTTYYVRAYATNKLGTAYGEEISFTTLEETNEIYPPTVTTAAVTEIGQTAALSGGNVTSDGGADVTARGVCWSTSQNPTIDDNKTENGSGTGSYNSNLSNLTPNTTYYVRAYATNSAGTSYGTQKSFTTLENVELPTVTTTNVTNITETTATCGGNVTSDGGADVTARGVCWSTSQNPTINNNHTTDGTGTGSYTSNISNLTPNTKYYVRAYATNSAGTGYGNEVSFTTLENVELPTLTTTNVTDVTQTTAKSGGNVTDDGGTTITARGVCWSTSQNPTISDSHTTDGNGIGSFTSSITGLTANTTYYVRAYATNSAGTGYGDVVSFTTLEEENGGIINGHEYVDLGLPSGLKWATCNVGADSPEDYGDYFAWGETETKSEYTQDNSITYYLIISELQSQGIIDRSGNLTPSHDAATANWGGSWRMPTCAELEELLDECTWTWTTQNGVNGYKVTGPNGNHIFLPAVGYRLGSSLYNAGGNGYYWSSTPHDAGNGYHAFTLDFYSGNQSVRSYDRYYGRSVRPVAE